MGLGLGLGLGLGSGLGFGLGLLTLALTLSSFLAGVFALCFSVPCQATVLKVYFKAQVERLKVTDQRIKLTNEMVQGMRVVKMCAAPCP